MLPKSEHEVKAYRVKEARLILNQTHCLTLSPFITAVTQGETLGRLKDFSEEVQMALTTLYSVSGKNVPLQDDRHESVEAVVDTLARMFTPENLDTGLNTIFLRNVEGVQNSMNALESGIKQLRDVPQEIMDTALNSLNHLGLFVDAVPQVYQRTL